MSVKIRGISYPSSFLNAVNMQIDKDQPTDFGR